MALVTVVVVAGIALSAIVLPVLLALVVIPVGHPLVGLFARRLPRSVSALFVLLLAVGILVAASWLMLRSIAANWSALFSGISEAITVATAWIQDQIAALTPEQLASIQENLRDLASTMANVMVGGATRSVLVIGSLLVGLLFFLVTFFFGVRDWDLFRRWAIGRMRPSLRSRGEEFLERFDVVLRNYWKGQAFIGVFDAVAIWVGLALIGVPLAAPIAILTLVISFIPYLGAVISTALAVFVALGTSSGGDAALTLVLCLFVFNTGENLMRPWLVGETVDMPVFVAFIAGTAGVLMAGAFGAILAIPLVALAGEARRIFLPDSTEAAIDRNEPAGDRPPDG
jgi:predicted PurR-regulated permease PerM